MAMDRRGQSFYASRNEAGKLTKEIKLHVRHANDPRVVVDGRAMGSKMIRRFFCARKIFKQQDSAPFVMSKMFLAPDDEDGTPVCKMERPFFNISTLGAWKYQLQSIFLPAEISKSLSTLALALDKIGKGDCTEDSHIMMLIQCLSLNNLVMDEKGDLCVVDFGTKVLRDMHIEMMAMSGKGVAMASTALDDFTHILARISFSLTPVPTSLTTAFILLYVGLRFSCRKPLNQLHGYEDFVEIATQETTHCSFGRFRSTTKMFEALIILLKRNAESHCSVDEARLLIGYLENSKATRPLNNNSAEASTCSEFLILLSTCCCEPTLQLLCLRFCAQQGAGNDSQINPPSVEADPSDDDDSDDDDVHHKRKQQGSRDTQKNAAGKISKGKSRKSSDGADGTEKYHQENLANIFHHHFLLLENIFSLLKILFSQFQEV